MSGGTCVEGASLLCLEATGQYYTNCVTSGYGCQSYSQIQTQNNVQMTVCLPQTATKTNEYLYSTLTYTCSGTCSTSNTLTLSYTTSQTYYQLTLHLKIRFYSTTASRSLTSSILATNGSSLASTTTAVDISQ